MLDYAANGSVFWTPEQLRTWFEGNDPAGAQERLVSWLDPAEGDPEDAAGAFWQAAAANLRDGRIRLVFVADEIPASLQRLVEFLNEQMPRVEVLAVEIRQYRAPGSVSGALVPRLVGQTARAQAGKQQAASAVRRTERWAPGEVLEVIARAGSEAAFVAGSICEWAEARPYIRVTGGTGVAYPSVTLSADSGRDRSRWRGVLSLYGHTGDEQPALEIRLRQMCSTPPYNRAEDQARLIGGLREIGIPRLASDTALAGTRPNIPLEQLTGGRASRLLSLVDQWITDVRAHATEPEPSDES